MAKASSTPLARGRKVAVPLWRLYGQRMRYRFPTLRFRKLLALLFVFSALPALSSAADAGTGDAGLTDVDQQLDGGAPESEPRVAQIDELLAGTLPVSVEPQSLFDVPLADETAVQIERLRLEALRRALDEKADGGAARGTKTKPKAAAASSSMPPSAGAAVISSRQWLNRQELDRARLAFYSLTKQEREALLESQRARVEAAKPQETLEKRQVREAEEERKKTLEAAKQARTEAEQLVGRELARVIDVERDVAGLREHFKDAGVELATQKERLLGWQKRVADARAMLGVADETYDALRRTLRASRDALDRALDAVDSSESAVPELGPNPLADIPSGISTETVLARRRAVEKQINEARREEHALRAQRAAALLDEIDALNRDRLGLLASLSVQKRAGITGFTQAGFDQSRSEARQLLLILRYHRYVAQGWLGDLRRKQGIQGVSSWGIAVVVVPWVLVIVGFVAFRRRSAVWLALLDKRLAESDRHDRLSAPSTPRKAVRFLMAIYRTLEWLLFFAVTLWLLPSRTEQLLEFQLIEVMVGWTFGGALIVNVINAIAVTSQGAEAQSTAAMAALRLRSLRLVGRVVVAFILVLLVSARLVGKGTVYSWVYSTCWFAGVPVFLILVRWWREIVFERVERVRRKSNLQTWVLANRRGWKSFFAAMVAAVQLFSLGAYKTIRNWVTSFNLARRVHAYLFKRELARLASDQPLETPTPLNPKAWAILAPNATSKEWVPCFADPHLEALATRARERRGGVIAIVGARGMGKSSLQRRLVADGSAVSVDCACDGLQQLRASLGAPGSVHPPLIFLDNAQRLIKPVRGGLGAFDETLAFARGFSNETLWVFAIDSVVWPFLRRARDSRPLFDEVVTLRPWTDEQIGALLTQRTAEAEVVPTFEALLEKLPPAADEIDKQEALAARRVAYFRMVWDYTGGNPAMALEVWRASLSEDATGLARVRPLVVPAAGELELLPDPALFILRAIMQLEPANVPEIAKATRLAEAQVLNAVRFGLDHGYLAEADRGVRVEWSWLRSIMVLLERRHLLVNP